MARRRGTPFPMPGPARWTPRPARRNANGRLQNGAEVKRLVLAPDGRRVDAGEYVEGGETKRGAPKLVVLAAGAVRSAVILLASGGVANRSDVVGRHFMNHNLSAM